MSSILKADIYPDAHSPELFISERVPVSFDESSAPISFIDDDEWVFQYHVLGELRYERKNVTSIDMPLREAIFTTFIASNADYRQTKVASLFNKVVHAISITRHHPLPSKSEWFTERGFFAFLNVIKGKYAFATLESLICTYVQMVNSDNNLSSNQHLSICKNKLAKKYCRQDSLDANQTLAMPIGISSRIMANAMDLVNAAENSIDALCATIKEVRENRGHFGTPSYTMPSEISRKHLEGSEWGALLDNNYRSQFVRMWVNRTITAAHQLIMAFTGVRIHELHRVHDDSFTTYNNNGIVYHTITAETSKLSNGEDTVDTWVCSSMCKELLELIRRLKDAAGVDSKSVMLSFQYLYKGAIKKNTSSHGRLIDNLTEDAILDNESYNEFLQLNRGCESALSVGDKWPLANHQWRRTFATMSLRFDLATLPALKRQFKHISLQMTEWYTNYARITRNEDTRVDDELNKLIRDVQVEMSTDVLFDAYNGDGTIAGGKGDEITTLRQNNAVPDVYRDRSAIKTMLEQGKFSLKFAGLNYCTNGYRCDQDGVVNAAFCVDCKSSIIDEAIAKKWKRLHERCVGHLEFAYDCGDVSPVSYAHFTSQIRAAEHVMDQFGMQYEKFQELS